MSQREWPRRSAGPAPLPPSSTPHRRRSRRSDASGPPSSVGSPLPPITSSPPSAASFLSSSAFIFDLNPILILFVEIQCSFIESLILIFRTKYVQEQVNIGSGPPGSTVRWFRSSSDQPRFINTVTFDSSENSPTLVMVHGYGASQGFFFRNFDALASRFRIIAIDQLGLVSESCVFLG